MEKDELREMKDEEIFFSMTGRKRVSSKRKEENRGREEEGHTANSDILEDEICEKC